MWFNFHRKQKQKQLLPGIRNYKYVILSVYKYITYTYVYIYNLVQIMVIFCLLLEHSRRAVKIVTYFNPHHYYNTVTLTTTIIIL